MAAVDPIVSLRAVHKAVREGGAERTVLRAVDLEVARGEAVAVLGRSGSGKSTLLNLIAGIDDADGGDITTVGLDVRNADERARAELRTRHLGFVFQSFHLLPTLTVAENVALPLELGGIALRAAMDRAAEVLGLVGLADRAGSWPEVLSGGEQQRVAVARALASRPALLLCDEPTGNLDDVAAATVLALVERLRREQGCAVILVTHSQRAAAICDRVLWLDGGALDSRGAEVRA
ncbi:MAG: ABC transporter ATP-binding protein [Planctomycetes bacterium]|nr:ABC transporter ATP-binding protein [Planctomycetota bacterium]